MVGGQVTDGVTTGKKFNYAGTCFTDLFTVSGDVGVPPLCGSLSGEHGMYDISATSLISKTLLYLNRHEWRPLKGLCNQSDIQPK